MKLYTIGYSGFPDINDFIHKLKEFNINALIDVRSNPYSAYFEQYNKNSLKPVLNAAGIAYKNYSSEFGARQENHSFYRNGRLDFELFAESEQFKTGFQKMYSNLDSFTFTLMCAEKQPITCHRTIMVARKFHEAGVEVLHLLPDRIQTHSEIEQELINKYYPNGNQFSLFDALLTDEDMLTSAYKKQNDQIGFKEIDLEQ